mgnify:FL=1
MSAPPDSRPRKLLSNLVARLEKTKSSAGLVDTKTDYKVYEAFALRVYTRADNHDNARKLNAVPSPSEIEAFSAAATFLSALNHFGPLSEFVTKRLQYAEWRAWDLATAAQG